MKMFLTCFLALGIQCAEALPKEEVQLISPSQKQLIVQAEIADEQEEQRKGLMFREKLAEGEGMLFLWDKTQVITMWMKNTYIPLDMIFIHNGQVKHVHENAVPHSLDIISSKHPVNAVLEVPAGYAKKHNIDTSWQLRVTPSQRKVAP